MGMQFQQGDYTVVSARPLDQSGHGTIAAAMPEALAMRFYGRRFTRQELEQMGVMFQGDLAIVQDERGVRWVLDLTPGL